MPPELKFCQDCGAAAVVSAPPRPAAPAPVFSYPASPYTPPAYTPVGSGPVAAYPGYAQQPGYPSQIPYAAPGAMPAPFANSPIPPGLHWFLVIVLSAITFGLFGLIWAFRQAAFVRKIDPSSKAVTLLVLNLLGAMVMVGLALAATQASTNTMAEILLVELVLNVILLVMGLVMVFSMRKSMVRYYNSVEPIGLRLSGVMTFFFSLIYFQYHFSRIANWKKTGRLQ
ncbi:MAG: hypothetical protein P4K94_01170 [Terracidiphilus sp.]|nr:hypothetical protein [Terracidiphilus sp.]MDR3799680.1 hypothetical protein [Terracidiphilus sp.]